MLPAGARQLENRYGFESCFAPAFCVFRQVVTGCVGGGVTRGDKAGLG